MGCGSRKSGNIHRERRALGISRVHGSPLLIVDRHGDGPRDRRGKITSRGTTFTIGLAEHHQHASPEPGCDCSACRSCRVATAAARAGLRATYFSTPAVVAGPGGGSGVVELNRATRRFSHVVADAGAGDDDVDLHHAVRAGGHVLAPVAAASGRIARQHAGGLVTHQRGGSALVTFAGHAFHDLQPECNCASCRGHRVAAAFARRGKRGVTLVAVPDEDLRGTIALFGYRSAFVVGTLNRDAGRFDMPRIATAMAGCQCGTDCIQSVIDDPPETLHVAISGPGGCGLSGIEFDLSYVPSYSWQASGISNSVCSGSDFGSELGLAEGVFDFSFVNGVCPALWDIESVECSPSLTIVATCTWPGGDCGCCPGAELTATITA